MENLDVMVLRSLSKWRSAGKRALLVTVARTWGSSPRPVGSIMALCEDGSVTGSVSGGCIEDDLIYRYARQGGNDVLHDRTPQLLKYGISADEAHRFGLPCGGTLELVLEYNPDAASLCELVAMLEEGKLVQRKVCMATGQVSLAPVAVPEALQINETEFLNVFGPEYRMLLIGAGQLTEYLATMALFSGFAVTVCDPREEYTQSWELQQATLLTDMPDDVVVAFKPDRRSCVVALTHDPKLDDLALLEALQSDAFYVGAIGSRSNNAARRERMIEYLGQTPETMARLRGPVGIYIGSKTPPEIAVSIMAEIIAVKNGVTLPRDFNVERAKEGLASMA